MYIVYKITNNVNHKAYIGITSDFDKRKATHICLSKKTNPPLLIQKKIKEYGANNFTFDIIHKCDDKEQCLLEERNSIKTQKTIVPHGYNVHPGGQYVVKTAKICLDSSERMKSNNPARLNSVKSEKASTILAKNSKTNESIIVLDRNQFSVDNNISYTTIGWAIQHNKELKNGWSFRYIKKRSIGI